MQGVGFRYTTREIAARFPLTGLVRNLPDGNVEIIAEGGERSLQEFWAALKQARVYRYVTREHVSWAPARGGYGEFTISHF